MTGLEKLIEWMDSITDSDEWYKNIGPNGVYSKSLVLLREEQAKSSSAGLSVGDIVYIVYDQFNLVVKCEIETITTKESCPDHMTPGDIRARVVSNGFAWGMKMIEKPQFCFKTFEEAMAARDYARHRIAQVSEYALDGLKGLLKYEGPEKKTSQRR
jgi:hypothetical protein